jgi:DNA-binding PadR family transcriptional regulator
MARLTRDEKAALLFFMTRGGSGRSRGEKMLGRLVRKGMLTCRRLPGFGRRSRTLYDMTAAGVQAAKSFMGREEDIGPRRWGSLGSKWGTSRLGRDFDRYGHMIFKDTRP